MGADELEARAAELLRAGLSREGAVARLTVRGGSMAPALCDGGTVEVARVASASAVRPGDVVLAYSPTGAVVCHRLLARRRGGGFWIAGDAALEIERVEEGSVLGVAAGRRTGAAMLRARTRWLVHRGSRLAGRGLRLLRRVLMAGLPGSIRRRGASLSRW